MGLLKKAVSAVKPKRAAPSPPVVEVEAGGCAPPIVVVDDLSALPACTQAVILAKRKEQKDGK